MQHPAHYKIPQLELSGYILHSAHTKHKEPEGTLSHWGKFRVIWIRAVKMCGRIMPVVFVLVSMCEWWVSACM